MNSKAPLPPRQGQRIKMVKPKRKMATWLKVVLSILVIFFIIVIGLAVYILKYSNDALDNISTVEDTQTTDVAPAMKPNKEPFSFLLLGIDYRPELPGRRTDVVMVGAIHPETKEAALVSLPRDTYFEIPGLYRGDKLNHFYPKFFELQKNGDLDSETPEDEMKVMLGTYLGIDIDHAAVLNFQGFVDVVDAVGGVNITVDQDMCYVDTVDDTDINLKQGAQVLNGKQALDYVRYRKSNCSPMTPGTNETDRNVRQNAVMQEVVGKMLSLGGVTKITKVIDAVADNFQIDMTPTQMKSSIMTYLNMNTANIHFLSVDGEWRSPYVYPDETKLEEAKMMLKKVLNGESLNTPELDLNGTEDSGNADAADSGN